MKKSFKPGTLLSPVPAVMVSCGDGEEKNIITRKNGKRKT